MAARDPMVDYRVHRGQDVVSPPAGSSPPVAVWYQRRFQDARRARKRRTVVLYADGSRLGDFGGCGFMTSTGCYGLAGGYYPPAITGPTNSTVQELRAIACGFPAARRWRGGKPIVIRTDSVRAIEFIARWRDGEHCMPAGYTTDRPGARAGAVTTLEWLAAQIAGLGAAVVTEHVRSHNGELMQEMVDGLARKGLRWALGHGTAASTRQQADDFARQFLISAGYAIGDPLPLSPRDLHQHSVLEAYAEPGAPGYTLRGRIRALYADLMHDVRPDSATGDSTGDGASASGAHPQCRDSPTRHPAGGGNHGDQEDEASPSALPAAFRAMSGSEGVGSPLAGPAMGWTVGW